MPRTKFNGKQEKPKTRREIFKSLWIPYTKRMPPNTEEKVLCWNYKLGQAIIVPGVIINAQINQLANEYISLDDLEHYYTGYFTEAWMRIYEP